MFPPARHGTAHRYRRRKAFQPTGGLIPTPALPPDHTTCRRAATESIAPDRRHAPNGRPPRNLHFRPDQAARRRPATMDTATHRQPDISATAPKPAFPPAPHHTAHRRPAAGSIAARHRADRACADRRDSPAPGRERPSPVARRPSSPTASASPPARDISRRRGRRNRAPAPRRSPDRAGRSPSPPRPRPCAAPRRRRG